MLTQELPAIDLLSLKDLLKMGDIRVEIVDGELIKMAAAGMVHQLLGSNVYDVLKPFVKSHNLGIVIYDGLTYLMFSTAGGLKDSFVPDLSFIRYENLLTDFDPTKPYPGIPDLAVEVVSPNDNAEVLQRKIRTYLEKGTEQVWVIYPATREIYQYRHDNNPAIQIYTGSQKLDVEALFPGLELTTDMIFDLPEWVMMQQ
ncbi:MAG: Uma2 family endonuclease [Anaerolineae bacterium]|nr:Uma2 family endonuclease [Anaerolineae bacterium]